MMHWLEAKFGFWGEFFAVLTTVAMLTLILLFAAPPIKYIYNKWDKYWGNTPVRVNVERNVEEQF